MTSTFFCIGFILGVTATVVFCLIIGGGDE